MAANVKWKIPTQRVTLGKRGLMISSATQA